MSRADADTPSLAALGLLLGGLSRRTLTLQTLAGASPSPSAAPRAVLSTTHLLLPAAVMQDATLARAAIAHAAAHLLYSSPAQAAGTLKPLGLAVASMIEDARVEALLMQRLPGVRRWFLPAQPAHGPHGLDGARPLARPRRKDASHLYKALWNNTEPTPHIAGRREDERNGDLQTVTVYSSAGEPVVTLSGDTLAVEQYAPCIYRCDSVRLNGRMKIEAKAGDLYDETFLTGNCALVAPPRRDPQQTAGLRLTN